MTEAPPLHEGRHLLAKAGPTGTALGDCPFTMKANLALRYSAVQFDVHYIDTKNKPAWFLDLNEDGTTPVFVDAAYAIGESDDIVEYADKIGSRPVKLVREDDPNWEAAFEAVSPVFGALVRLIKSTDEERDGCRDKLAAALRSLDAFLASVSGPFLLGDDISALDCNLAPKLFHIRVAAAHYRQFEIPQELVNVHAFMQHMDTQPEWKLCVCPDDVVVWGWSKFFS